MSNHPAPLAGLGGAPLTNARQAGSTSSVVTSIATHSNSVTQSGQISTSAVRDELVRAVMPELQVLVQHLVATAVERSMAPMLEKQRELELALKELRSIPTPPAHSSNTPYKQAPEAAKPTRSAHMDSPLASTAAATREVVTSLPATVATRQAARVPIAPAAVTANAYDESPLADIPSELNGSRRKRVVVYAFAVGALALLLSVIGLSVASNMGAYF